VILRAGRVAYLPPERAIQFEMCSHSIQWKLVYNMAYCQWCRLCNVFDIRRRRAIELYFLSSLYLYAQLFHFSGKD